MANEKRLIDANELMSNIHFYDEQQKNDVWRTSDIEALLAEQPTVDAVEVVHGRWILEKEFADGTADYKCSVCEYDDSFYRNLVNAWYKYCPYCGAKMDGDGNG